MTSQKRKATFGLFFLGKESTGGKYGAEVSGGQKSLSKKKKGNLCKRGNALLPSKRKFAGKTVMPRRGGKSGCKTFLGKLY